MIGVHVLFDIVPFRFLFWRGHRQAGGHIGPHPTIFWYEMMDYFRDVRGAVKGKQNDLVGEGVQMCVGVVLGLVGRGAVVWQCVSTRITFRGLFMSNVAKTSGFCSAGFFSGSGSSAEPVVLTRATHNGGNHGERRVGVKGVIFS
tara:strand:+ start:227580 stop:228014 length:435 start_codon:yes stop_codon:yes gene_type:complete